MKICLSRQKSASCGFICPGEEPLARQSPRRGFPVWICNRRCHRPPPSLSEEHGPNRRGCAGPNPAPRAFIMTLALWLSYFRRRRPPRPFQGTGCRSHGKYPCGAPTARFPPRRRTCGTCPHTRSRPKLCRVIKSGSREHTSIASVVSIFASRALTVVDRNRYLIVIFLSDK